jgi:anti-sigma-K factor RskA
MIDERQTELASLYAAGALPPLEAKEFEATLETNTELRQFTNQLRDASAALGLSAKSVAPPPALREKVLAAVNRPEKVVRLDFKDQKPRDKSSWLPWAIAACFAVCAGVLLQKYRTNNHDLVNRIDQTVAQSNVIARLKNENQMLEKKGDEARAQMAAMGQRLEAQNRMLVIATNEIARLEKERQLTEIRTAMLTSQAEDSPKTIAVSLWDPKRQEGVFVGRDLAALGPNNDYQLWVFDHGTPVAAGLLTVDAEGRVRISFRPDAAVGNAEQFAVTIEKKGGEKKEGDVPAAPKGKMILKGTWL